MHDVINNPYDLIVSLQMETGNVPDRSNNISVSIGLQNVMDRYGTDQKVIRYNGNIVLISRIFQKNVFVFRVLHSQKNISFFLYLSLGDKLIFCNLKKTRRNCSDGV